MTKDIILELIQDNIVSVWHSVSTDSLSDKEWDDVNIEEYSDQIKKDNENLLNEFLENINKKTNDFNSFINRERILYVREYLGDSLCREYFNNIASFYDSIRSIEPQFDLNQLWQVVSNYLVYAIILAMLGRKQQCNDSIKAFCLLYPYTDNYIDSKDIPLSEKEKFNDMIFSSLNDLPVTFKDDLYLKIHKCLKDCQNYLDGTRKEAVTSALLLMLDSQRNSSSLDGMTSAQFKDNYNKLVSMLAYKGGMTILNDYIFAIDSEESSALQFFLQLGMVLQLADDLLDTNDDILSNSPTLYSLVPDIKTREEGVNRLLHFTIHVFTKYIPEDEKVHTFMLRTILILLGFAVMRNGQYYSDEFKDNICRFMPFSKEYLLTINKRLSENANPTDKNLQKTKKQIDSIVALLKNEI